MSTPIKRVEVITGYLAGYGIFTVIQTLIVIIFAVNVLDVTLAGSIWNVILINLILALTALSLGILLSTFASSEFQMLQFIPIVIIPQIFFSGIIPVEGMADWLQVLARFMPLLWCKRIKGCYV
jgi:ABC-2 type transport system permease protein